MTTKPDSAEATFRALEAAKRSLQADGVETDASALLNVAALIVANHARATGRNPDPILETLRDHILIKTARKASYFGNPELKRILRERDGED